MFGCFGWYQLHHFFPQFASICIAPASPVDIFCSAIGRPGKTNDPFGSIQKKKDKKDYRKIVLFVSIVVRYENGWSIQHSTLIHARSFVRAALCHVGPYVHFEIFLQPIDEHGSHLRVDIIVAHAFDIQGSCPVFRMYVSV